MSEVKKWVGQCLRKKKLKEDQANYTIKRAKENGQDLYKYYCPHCMNWHVTKQEQ